MPEPSRQSETPAAGLRGRLEELAGHFSQAEIARRVGTSRANVSRYLAGRRISAEFCTSLIRELGVNPSWLMTGEGAMFLADVSADVGRLAGDLLELVQALDAVGRVRLGALAGDPDKRTLRALDQALRRHQSVSGELNERSRPVFERLLSDLRDALVRGAYAQAEDLCRAAEQVGRLCDDAELHRQLASRRGYLSARRGDTEAAATQHRQAFLAGLTAAGALGGEVATDAYNYANQLDRLGRFDEGRRLCDAALALLGPAQAATPGYQLLVCKRGTFDLNLGALRRCLATVAPVIGAMEPADQDRVRSAYVEALILAGALPWAVADALAFYYGKPWTMLRFARWRGDAAKVRRAADLFGEHPERGHNPAIDRWHERWGPWLADAIEFGDRDTVKRLRDDVAAAERAEQAGPLTRFQHQALLAEAAAAAGDTRGAKRAHGAAASLLEDLPEGVLPDCWDRAFHHRTAPGEAAAREFFRPLARAGYSLFASGSGTSNTSAKL